VHIEIPKVIENASPKDMTRPVGDDFGCKVRAETHPEGTLASFDLIARLMLLSSVLIIPATCFLLLLSSLDKANLGHAKFLGMVGKEPVLGLDPTGKLYAVLDALCYIGYVNWSELL